MSEQATESALTLQERALDAWNKYEARLRSERESIDEENRKRNVENLRDSIKRRLGVDCEPNGPTVEIDGLTFSFENKAGGVYDKYGLFLVRTCQMCCGRVYDKVNNLAHLHEVIEGPLGYPHDDDTCIKRDDDNVKVALGNTPPRIVSQHEGALLDALTAFIRVEQFHPSDYQE